MSEPILLPLASPEVLVLGAGFSINVSEEFVCTDDLGKQATLRAGIADERLPAKGFRAGNFETWLSQLAEDQPYLSEAENFHNRARFMDVSRALVDVLRDSELEAFKSPAQPWLLDLLSIAHYRRPTIITLNYDTVIEVAIEGHALPRTDDSIDPSADAPMSGSLLEIGADDILANFPPRIRGSLPARGISYSGSIVPLARSFRLLKLHGSIDWFWAPGDPTGETLRRATVTSRFADPRDDPELRRDEVEGLQPFIVPPTATKSAYYSNLRTRWLWTQAAQALNEAERISLLGYSIPPADLVMSGMLAAAVHGHCVDLKVVNLKPDDPAQRLRELGATTVSELGGDDCMQSFVNSYRDQAAAELVQTLRASALGDAYLVAFTGSASPNGRAAFQAVKRITRGDCEAELSLELAETGVPIDPDNDLGLSALVSKITERVRRLVVRTSDNRKLHVVAAIVNLDTNAIPQRDFVSLLTAGI